MTTENPEPQVEPSWQAQPPEEKTRGLYSLRFRDFRLLWLTSLFSSAARMIQQLTLGWLVFDLTGSTLLLGTVQFLYLFPSLVTAPVIGLYIDRFDRRRVLISSQIGLAAAAILLALDAAAGTVETWHVFVFAVFSGFENTVIHVVRQALIPRLVPQHALMNAISLNSIGFNVTRIAAPSLAGFLLVTLGVTGNFILQAILVIGVAAAAFPMHIPRMDGAVDQGESFLTQVGAGMRLIWRTRTLKVLFALHLIFMLLAMPFVSFLPALAEDVLDIKADGLGLLYTATGVGALLGTGSLTAAGNVRQKGALALAASAVMGAGMVALGWSTWLPASIALLTMFGAAQMLFSTINMTLVQSNIPPEMQGRVMSIYQMGHAGLATGTLLMGGIAGVVGISMATAIMGGSLLSLAVMGFVAVPSLRRI